MRPSAPALVLALALGGCLGWFGGDEGAPARPDLPDAPVALETTLEGSLVVYRPSSPPQGGLDWMLLRGASLVDRGNLTAGPGDTWLGAITKPIGAGEHGLRIREGGVPIGERRVTFAPFPWYPAVDGEWTFRAERVAGNATVADLSGTAAAADGVLRVVATGVLEDASANGSLRGTVTEFSFSRRGLDLVASRLAYTATLRLANGSTLGESTYDRVLLGEAREADRHGDLHDAHVHRTWSRTTGLLHAANGTRSVDVAEVTLEYTARKDGTPLRYERWTWDNSTEPRRTAHNADFGAVAAVPRLLPAWRGYLPLPLRAGDAGGFEEPGGAKVLVEVRADGDGLRGVGTVSGSATGAIALTVDARGSLVRYDETVTAAGVTSVVRLAR